MLAARSSLICERSFHEPETIITITDGSKVYEKDLPETAPPDDLFRGICVAECIHAHSRCASQNEFCEVSWRWGLPSVTARDCNKETQGVGIHGVSVRVDDHRAGPLSSRYSIQ